MKKITSLLFASVLVISPISAVYAHQNADKHEMPMMKDQMMKKMQSHMEDMRAMLAAVKKETDPSKREVMLHDHAKKMEGMMGMMKMMAEMKPMMEACTEMMASMTENMDGGMMPSPNSDG